MIEVKLYDFENHRDKLTKYAKNLLRTRGHSNHKLDELNELSKDIVQNTYLSFQKSFNSASFVSESHLYSFLSTILYRRYQDEINIELRNAQWILFKSEEFDSLNIKKTLKTNHNLTNEQFDIIGKFRLQLKPIYLEVLDLLLEGYNQYEIAEKLKKSRVAITHRVDYLRRYYIKYDKNKNI